MTGVLAFIGKFIVIAPVCTVLFWLAAPSYIWLIGQCSGAMLRELFGVPIERLMVEPQGILNTQTLLGFVIGGQPRPIPLVGLIMTLPTYVALILATGGISVLRRLGILLLGAGILFVSHIIYIVLVFQFGSALRQSPQIPYMIVMLPFLLWIVLGYWRHIEAFWQDANLPEASQDEAHTREDTGHEGDETHRAG